MTPKPKKTTQRITKAGALNFTDNQNLPIVDYKQFIDHTRVEMDNNNKRVVIKMFENAAFLSKRVKTAMATFGKPLMEVVTDIAESQAGTRRLAPNTVYQYVRAHEFMNALHAKNSPLYHKLLESAESGITRFNHVVTVSRSPASMDEKMKVLEEHVDNKKGFMSKKALEIQLDTLHNPEGKCKTNYWHENELLRNFTKQYINEKESIFAPFGSEGTNDQLIVPEEDLQKEFINCGFVLKTGEVVPDNFYPNILLHFPQHNLINRTDAERGSLRYQTFSVNNYPDFLNRSIFLINEAVRTLRRGGILGVVAWNNEWAGIDLQDYCFDVRTELERHLQWVNTAVISIEPRFRNLFYKQAYRMMFIFKKI